MLVEHVTYTKQSFVAWRCASYAGREGDRTTLEGLVAAVDLVLPVEEAVRRVELDRGLLTAELTRHSAAELVEPYQPAADRSAISASHCAISWGTS